jgi:hypothetical protein
MMIPAKVSCASCGHEGYEIEFLRCTQCLERFCLAPLHPCVRGCACSSARPPLASQASLPAYFQHQIPLSGSVSNFLP